MIKLRWGHCTNHTFDLRLPGQIFKLGWGPQTTFKEEDKTQSGKGTESLKKEICTGGQVSPQDNFSPQVNCPHGHVPLGQGSPRTSVPPRHLSPSTNILRQVSAQPLWGAFRLRMVPNCLPKAREGPHMCSSTYIQVTKANSTCTEPSSSLPTWSQLMILPIALNKSVCLVCLAKVVGAQLFHFCEVHLGRLVC